MHTECTPFVSVQSNLIKFFLVIRYVDLAMNDNWEWNNATKVTPISVIAGIVFGIVLKILIKHLKETF